MSIWSDFLDKEHGYKKVLVAICVPAKDQMHSKFAYCLSQMLLYTQLRNIEFRLFFSLGTLIVNQRENLVKDALEIGASHIMWLDSDMSFPPDIVQRLLSHNLPVVAANYATRRSPVKTVAFTNARDWESYLEHRKGINDEGLVEVAAVGMGCMMVETSVYTELKRPWYQLIYDVKAEDFHGEDMYFCETLRNKDIKIWIDCELTIRIGHIGDLPYKHHMVTNPPSYY